MNSKQDSLKQETKDNPLDPKSEIIIAVLAVISKKSRERKRTIAAASLQEIRNGLKKHYEKDLSERQILNVIHDLRKIVIKEKDPRNHRRSLYKTNPKYIEEVTLTLVTLNNDKEHSLSDFEGILYSPLVKTEKKKFLVINKA
jgi:hypothetical protein